MWYRPMACQFHFANTISKPAIALDRPGHLAKFGSPFFFINCDKIIFVGLMGLKAVNKGYIYLSNFARLQNFKWRQSKRTRLKKIWRPSIRDDYISTYVSVIECVIGKFVLHGKHRRGSFSEATWRRNDVLLALLRRQYVASTSVRSRFDVMWLLGFVPIPYAYQHCSVII